MPLDETRAADETGHLADHNALHTLYNEIETAGGVAALEGGGGAVAFGRAKTASTTPHIIPGVPIMNVGTRLLGGSRLHYMPFFVDTQITVDQIGAEVSSAATAGNTVRLGIYAATEDWQPGALVVDAGTIAADSTGYKTLSLASVVLAAGTYLFAVHTSTAGPTFRAYRGALRGGAIDTVQSAGNALILQVWVNTAIAALPDPGTAWSIINGSNVGWEYYTYLRVSVP